jgi:hypothetical protein
MECDKFKEKEEGEIDDEEMTKFVMSMLEAPTKCKSTNPVTAVTGGGGGYYNGRVPKWV